MRSSRRIHSGTKALVALLVVSFVAVSCSSTKSSSGGSGSGSANPAGIGTKAALDQATCTKNGHTNFQFVGGGSFCVKPWPAGSKNGGATAQGVTATTVKVVIYVPDAQMLAAGEATGAADPVTNQATGKAGSWSAMIQDYNQIYQYGIKQFSSYQTWGRTPQFTIVTASGSDEVSQRADALKVIAMKPFMVIDGSDLITGAQTFEAATANAHILTFGVLQPDVDQAPYRWASESVNAGPYLTASFLGESLSGKPAQYAGETDFKTKTRTFGLVYPSTGFNLTNFESLLKTNGSSPIVIASAINDTDATAAQQVVPTIISKLKASDVTSVVLYIGPTVIDSLMTQAAQQDYFPEWVYTGQEFQDFDYYGRENVASEMDHAFGLGVLPPLTNGENTGLFDWYWGDNQGVFGLAGLGWLTFVYDALTYAGPDLTVQNVKNGLFAVPAVGGASDGTTTFQTGFGRTVGLPYDEYSLLGTDRTLIWWDPNITGGTNAVPSLVGKGKFEYLNDAKRLGYKQFPTTEPPFFNPSVSVDQVALSTEYPNGIVPATNPCTQCPSQAS